MSALLLAVLLSQAPVVEETASKPPDFRLHVGGHVGFPFLLGAQATGTYFVAGRPRFDVDATWEPSVTLQSYSVGGAYHVLDRFFFAGVRLRLVQYQPPWARGPVELFFGLGADLGVRFRVGPQDKGVISIALHSTWIPGQATNLQTLLGLSAGFSWSVFER